MTLSVFAFSFKTEWETKSFLSVHYDVNTVITLVTTVIAVNT